MQQQGFSTQDSAQVARSFFERMGSLDEEEENRELDRLMRMYNIQPSKRRPDPLPERPLRIAYG